MNRHKKALSFFFVLSLIFFYGHAESATRSECRDLGGNRSCTEPDINNFGDFIGWGNDALNSYNACSVIGTEYGVFKNNGQSTYIIVPGGESEPEGLYLGNLVNYCTSAPHKPDASGRSPKVYTASFFCSTGSLNNSAWPSLCLPDEIDPEKNTGPCCEKGGNNVGTGNPINHATGNKYQQEIDYQGPSGLEFVRSYNSAQIVNIGISSPAEIGRNWRHSYKRLVKRLRTSAKLAVVYRHDGRAVYFSLNGANWLPDRDIADRLVQLKDDLGNTIGWQYQNASNDDVEAYDADGKLIKIISRNGQIRNLTYSDSSTPISTAPWSGLLISVADQFNRKLQLQYDIKGRITKVIDPSGGEYVYGYDEATSIVLAGKTHPGNLTSVTYPDGKKKLYWYNEQTKTANTDIPTALTGITDENGVRFASYYYDSTKRAVSTEHTGGVNKYIVTYDAKYEQSTVADPLGIKRIHTLQVVQGVAKAKGRSQPAGAGYGSASSAVTYDANGNLSSSIDFKGNKTTYTYDLTRNLETSRVEAAGTAQARTILTEWHSTYRLPARIAEPRRITTNTYDAKGNLLTKMVQATLDATGAQGFNASLTGNPRTWSYTYNEFGQVLTETDPRGGVTRYDYDAQGNLVSITNAAGHVTTLSHYDGHGRPGRIIDANGLVTDLTYSPRGWLISRSVAGEVTSYYYDGVGQLTQVTLPDESTISYVYDDARRLTGITDSLDNSISYTLDAKGNRIGEEVKDATGALARQTRRIYDALSRLQSVTESAGPASPTPGNASGSSIVPTVATLIASPQSPTLGQNVTLYSTVMGSSPTGTVTFMNGTTVLGTATVFNGAALFITGPLAAGRYAITATYNGDGQNKASTSAAESFVIAGPSQLSWIIPEPPDPIRPEQLVTVRVQVNDVQPRPEGIGEVPLMPGGGPTGEDGAFGTVTLKGGTTVLGTAKILCNRKELISLTATNQVEYTGCWAQFDHYIAAAGMDTLTAEYSGNIRYLPSVSSTTNRYALLPQVTKITLTGTPPAGATFAALIVRPGKENVLYSYTVTAADTTLSDVARNFAAVIDASADFDATASEGSITVSGLPHEPYTLTTSIPSGGTAGTKLYQEASLPRPGTRAKFDLTVRREAAVDVGTVTFEVRFTRNSNQAGGGIETVRDVYYTLPNWEPSLLTPDFIFNQICNELYLEDQFYCTYDQKYNKNIIVTPIGQDDLFMHAAVKVWSPHPYYGNNYYVSSGRLENAQTTVPDPQPQIVDVAIDGTPIPGAVYAVTLDGVPYSYTASPSDTSNEHIAAGLAAVIDLAASYAARPIPGRTDWWIYEPRVRIEHASANTPFAYSTSVQSYPGTTIGSTVGQQAR